ncbi:MAG: SDR family oxidoreductase [Bacteroidales bacterium]|nr:SDR family oxidoreductase [Bacteroidales bacterium]
MNIIVNGGTRGIGKEIVLLLAGEKSNHVLVTGRNKSALKRLSDSAVHGNIKTLSIDLADLDDHLESFIKGVCSYFTNIDILINNAGSIVVKDFTDFKNSEARRLMETNFFGPASVIRTVRPFMKKGSHIVNISSMGGFQGSAKFRGLSYYSASKAALSCLSECLAEEFSQEGIIVNCLALGSVQTEMFVKAFPGYTAPVGAREMAEFIVDFALKGNKFFNGKVIPVAFSNP